MREPISPRIEVEGMRRVILVSGRWRALRKAKVLDARRDAARLFYRQSERMEKRKQNTMRKIERRKKGQERIVGARYSFPFSFRQLNAESR